MPWEEVKPEEVAEKLPSVMGVGRDKRGWEEVSEDEVKAGIYEAYAGPETGGFGITPAPTGVAAMRPDQPPSPFAGVLPGGAVPPPTAVPQVPRVPQLAPRVPVGEGSPVTIPIGSPVQAQAQSQLEAMQPPISPPATTDFRDYVPDVGTPYRAGRALGRMWNKTERGGKYDALGHGFVNHGLNALLQIPSFAENLEDNGKQAALWLTEQMGYGSPELRNAVEGAASLPQMMRGVSPVGDLRAEDVRAAPELMPGGKSFEDSRREQLARTQGLKLTHPTAYAAGEIGATAGEVVGTKRITGMSKLMRARDIRLSDAAKKAREAKLERERPGGGQEWSKQKLTSPGYYSLAKGLGRAGETTMEGWLTAALNEGDPLEMAAIAGTGQAAASPILTLASIKGRPGRGRMMTALAKAAVAGTAITVWELLPGGDEKTATQALDSGFDKVKGGIATNLFLGAIGMGRFRTQDLAQVNRFTDDIQGVQRAGTLATIERFAGSDDRTRNKIKRVLRTMATRPDTIKPHTLDLLSGGLTKGGDAFVKVIEKLEVEGEL